MTPVLSLRESPRFARRAARGASGFIRERSCRALKLPLAPGSYKSKEAGGAAWPRLFECLLNLHYMLFRAVVPDAHAHVLPGAGGEFGDACAVELSDEPRLRVQPRIGPCYVRAVPSILGIVLAGAVAGLVVAGAVALVVLAVVALVVLRIVLAVVGLLVVGVVRHDYHLAVSMPRRSAVMRRLFIWRILAKLGKNALTFPAA